ncbi:hypothetical protein FA13DRAFT_1778752 [Coprinellus micaceus]|uniref:Uncharacterized protein n=1 Tax=Coprinellus micaceus TaxID=71717 RepID=A0A4Y7SKR2_COPMI|nr:hypothetical protein FA13DRAFT_1778752 [Coprinellus micaceus]
MEQISDCSAIDIALGSRPDTDVLLEPFVLEVFSPSPKGDTALTTSSEDTALVEKCGALIERIQWLFKSDQYTFDAYGYEYSGLGLWPVLVQPRVDPDAAKRLLLDILTAVDPYIAGWVSRADKTVVGPHLAVLKVFKAAFEAYPAVHCWTTVHDALCRFLRVLLCTSDVNIYALDCEVLKYEQEQERSGPFAVVDAQHVRNSESVQVEFSDEWLARALSPVSTLEYTSSWDDLSDLGAHSASDDSENESHGIATQTFESVL